MEEKKEEEKKVMGSIQTEEQTVTGYAAKDESGFLSPFRFNLRNTGAEDVVLKVIYCGICHTDLHLIKNDLHYSQYPMVPGHEVVGEVTEVGWEVRKFKVGDKVGVGCICGSCNSCSSCKANIEQYCNKRIWTYNDVYHDGRTTYGGFANSMVVNQKFVVQVPVNLPLEEVAPLLCAGVTIYSPLRHYGYIKPGLRGAILGLGGVGHIGVLMAKAMGHHVTVISSSEKKRVEALKNLSADEYLVSSDAKKMQVIAESFDYIIDTIPAMHALEPYLPLLKVNGNLIIVGVVPAPMRFFSHMIGLSRRSISGSFIGSMEEIQEMLNFCGEKQVKCIVEVVKLDYINKAMERLEKNDVHYRFVVDVANSNLP